MEFVEGRINEEKVFGDVVFPKTLLPPVEAESGTTNLAEMVGRDRAFLATTLHRHGAILFRGFRVDSPEAFDQVVRAFGWDDIDQVVAITRIRITDRVYTANEAPLDQFINFHHEMSLAKQSPSKIFFFCSEPGPQGGETAIIPSHVIVDKMEEQLPEVVAKLSEVGFVFRFKTASEGDSDSPTVMVNKTWKWMLKAENEVEAEKMAGQKLACSSVNFNSDGSAVFVYGPMNPIKEFGGKRVCFMPILGFTNNINDANSNYGDGSRFSLEDLITYREILEKNCVDVKWQKGDVLLVDNLAVQHARRPGKPPRVILVSVCK